MCVSLLGRCVWDTHPSTCPGTFGLFDGRSVVDVGGGTGGRSPRLGVATVEEHSPVSTESTRVGPGTPRSSRTLLVVPVRGPPRPPLTPVGELWGCSLESRGPSPFGPDSRCLDESPSSAGRPVPRFLRWWLGVSASAEVRGGLRCGGLGLRAAARSGPVSDQRSAGAPSNSRSTRPQGASGLSTGRCLPVKLLADMCRSALLIYVVHWDLLPLSVSL